MADLPPVGDVEQRGERVAPQPAEFGVAGQHRGVEGRQRQHDEERREQPSGPARPERAQPNGAVLAPLGDEQRGDEETRETEEQVDAEEAAAQVTGVEEEHADDRDAAHAVERGDVAETRPALHGRWERTDPVRHRPFTRTATVGANFSTTMDDATYLDKIGQVAHAADIRSIHVLAWRDLDDPEAGGSEVHASEVAARWAAAGIDVTMRTSFAANHPSHCRREGYRVVRKAGRYLVFPRSVLSELAGRMGPRDGLVEVWNGVPFFSPVWCRGSRMVFLHHPHVDMWGGVLSPGLARLGRIVETRFAPALYRGTPVVTLSESSKLDIVQRLGLPADVVRVVPPGVDRRFTPGGERSPHPLVAVVGRLVPVKRLDALVVQLARVRTTIPDLEVVVGGTGYEHAALVELIGRLDAGSWVHLPGRLRPDEVVDLYRRAWVLASASHAEGWGMTITEAGACGTPAVVSDIGGHRDAVVHAVTGLLAGSDDELGDAIARVLSDADLRASLGRHAHSRASSLSWSATALGALEVLAVDAAHRHTR